MLLYFIALIVRSGYSSQVSNLQIDPDNFTDLSKYQYLKAGVINFNCIVILFFLFGGVMMHITELSEDIKVIADSMVNVIIPIKIILYFLLVCIEDPSV